MVKGKVYLVGAGPGHLQLLTLKAYDLICSADILVYDRLIPEEMLNLTRPDAERIYVGKTPGCHQHGQKDINTILVAAACRANVVVRLKGGDPALFGRGGEEAEFLSDHGIPFDVVPGVSAAISVPMSAGIPVTHRDYASTVALVTSHRRDDPQMNEIDWEALARLDTLIFFMGVSQLPEITLRLMAHGLAPTTPAAVIQMAYWPDEQVITGSLKDLPQLAQQAGIRPPATIVVGNVVKLRNRLTTLQRDLRQDAHAPMSATPSAEHTLRRIEAFLCGAQDLRAALELRLFDDLDHPLTPEALAAKSTPPLSIAPLRQVLTTLANLGFLKEEKGSYCNTRETSAYLKVNSATSLIENLTTVMNKADKYQPHPLLPVGEKEPGIGIVG